MARQSMPDLHQMIMTALDKIKDPCSIATGHPLGLREMGLVKKLTIDADGGVTIDLRLTSPFCHMIGFFKSETKRRVGELPGVNSVSLNADNGLDWSPANIDPAADSERQKALSILTT